MHPHSFRIRDSKRLGAFTLVEILVVLAIVSLLAAIALPAFTKVQARARQATCQSNLRQIGMAFSMYHQDYDGRYPYAVDPVDRLMQSDWKVSFPELGLDMFHLREVQQVLQPYIGSPQLFHCPADIGFTTPDYLPVMANALPSSYEKFGTSYYYRTELAGYKAGDFTVEFPGKINVMFELVGFWHGGVETEELRYQTLFADGHVASLSRSQTDTVWDTPLNSFVSSPKDRDWHQLPFVK